MFISHFNRYFEKHAKITYFVLLIIIIATFVIFVTPGDVLGGGGGRRHSDIGTMFGKRIKVETFQKEVNKATLAIWLQYRNLFGQSLNGQREVLFEHTLFRMRMVHEARERGILKKVTDEDIKDFYRNYEPIQEDGKFSPEAFQGLITMCANALDLTAPQVDEVVRENIAIERLTESVTASAKVTDADLDDAMASYALQCATIGIDLDGALPSTAEVKEHFDTRKDEIRKALPRSRNAVVAYFNYADLSTRMQSELMPTAEQVKAYFDSNAAVLYKDKDFASVEKEIRESLLRTRVRVKAGELGRELSESFSSEVANESASSRQKRFVDQAAAAGAACQESGWLALGSRIAGKSGDQVALAREIRGLDQVGQVGGCVVGADYAAVPFVAEIKETELPAELNDDLTRFIQDEIVRERALAFYEETLKVPYEQFRAAYKAFQQDNRGRQPNAAERQQLQALSGKLDSQLLMKFYIPQNRDFARVVFPVSAYLPDVPAPGEADLQRAYDENKEEYQKVEVRLAVIGVDVAGLEGEALKAKYEKIAKARQKLDAGADFMAVAGEFAENAVVEEKEMSDLAARPEVLRNAVSGLEKGQLTPVIEVNGQRQIVKMLDRRDGRTLSDVRDELVKVFKDSQAAQLASQDARKLSDELSEGWWKADEGHTEFAGAAVLKELSAAYPKAVYAEFTHVTLEMRGTMDGAQPPELLNALYSATEGAPVIEAVSDSEGSAYVGYLTRITEERLADPATEGSYYMALRAAYLEHAAMGNALAKAESEIARIGGELANGADFKAASGALEFAQLPAVSANDIMTSSAVVQSIASSKNINLDLEFIRELESIKEPGHFMTPKRAERRLSFGPDRSFMGMVIPVGYQLLFVSGRTVPAVTDADKEARTALQSRLLGMRRSEALEAFYQDLEKRSATMLREGVMP